MLYNTELCLGRRASRQRTWALGPGGSGFSLETNSMRKYAPWVASAGVLAMFLQTSSPTQGQTSGNAKPRLVAELIDAGGGALTLNVTFYGAQPKPDKAEETLRHCLEAATVMHPDEDITAKAWFGGSGESSKRQAIALAGGDGLLYVAKDQSIRLAGNDAAPSAKASDDVATITNNEKVARACQKLPQDQAPALAGAALEKRGKKRRSILKAMRGWCKENDVARSKDVDGCIWAISRAVAAMKSPPIIESEDLAATLARGEASFTVSNHCDKCHRAGGRGGPRAPSLADDKWLHCDGSIEGIKKVIMTGVPQNKMKDTSRPFPMRGARNLANNEKELADLAAYVHSLSRH